MSGVGKVITAPFRAIGSLFTPPKVPPATPAPSRDDVEDRDAVMQRLRKRRGQAANEVLGPGGAEAAIGTSASKMKMGE